MARISLQEAKDRADEWQAQREDQDRAPNAGHFRDASPHNLIEMWETGKRLDGRRLNNWEFGCLVEAWTACFGDLPPRDDAVANSVAMMIASIQSRCQPMIRCCAYQKLSA